MGNLFCSWSMRWTGEVKEMTEGAESGEVRLVAGIVRTGIRGGRPWLCLQNTLSRVCLMTSVASAPSKLTTDLGTHQLL